MHRTFVAQKQWVAKIVEAVSDREYVKGQKKAAYINENGMKINVIFVLWRIM